jgi:hypothetical protein
MNNNTKRSPPTVLAGGCGISPGSAGRGSCAFSAHFQRIFSAFSAHFQRIFSAFSAHFQPHLCFRPNAA